MRNFNFQIDSDLDARLKAYSEATGVPMSEIIRRAIDSWIPGTRFEEVVMGSRGNPIASFPAPLTRRGSLAKE